MWLITKSLGHIVGGNLFEDYFMFCHTYEIKQRLLSTLVTVFRHQVKIVGVVNGLINFISLGLNVVMNVYQNWFSCHTCEQLRFSHPFTLF